MSSQPLPALRGNFVLVRADELRLLLPQDQVGAAGYLDARPEPADEPGLLKAPGQERVFAALSSRMSLLPSCPSERFVVTTLGQGAVGGESISWCWDELQVLIDVELRPTALPVTLVAPETPIACWVEHAGDLAFLCDATRLQEFALAQRS